MRSSNILTHGERPKEEILQSNAEKYRKVLSLLSLGLKGKRIVAKQKLYYIDNNCTPTFLRSFSFSKMSYYL